MTFTKEFGHTTIGIAVKVEFTATLTITPPHPQYSFSITTLNASKLIIPSYTNVNVPILIKPSKTHQSFKNRITNIFSRKEKLDPTYVAITSSRHAYMRKFDELDKMPHFVARKNRLVEYEQRCEDKTQRGVPSKSSKDVPSKSGNNNEQQRTTNVDDDDDAATTRIQATTIPTTSKTNSLTPLKQPNIKTHFFLTKPSSLTTQPH
ncbi:MAG: hypothetical protein M1812_006784 [Candelaria pacifica]|nr:MAG: hypothetical protein M1812_006784 [Candelaria pacifica]